MKNILLGLVLCAVANTSVALPESVKVDQYLISLSEAFKAKDWATSARFVKKLEALKAKKPNNYYYIRGEVQFNQGDIKNAQQALDRYISKTGKKGRYYKQALRLYTKIELALDDAKAAGQKWVKITAGCFSMGSPGGETGRDDDERKHQVCIEKDFWMSKYEVTNAEFRKFKSSHTSKEYKGYSLDGEKQPAVYVNFDDAVAYAKWLSKKTGHTYRLPTEAEWEFAARAGTSSARYWGNSSSSACSYANVLNPSAKSEFDFSWDSFNCSDGYKVTAPVGQFQPNDFGLYDMLGNVWEWTCSEFTDPYGGAEKRCASAGNTRGRVLRGGSWSDRPRSVRSAIRNGHSRGVRGSNLGFRLIRTNR